MRTSTPLVERSTFFGNPENAEPRISPDGTMLAYLAPSDGVLSVWVRTLGQADDRVAARDPDRPITILFWQGDSRHVLYLQDTGGNENHHLFQASLDGGAPRDLTEGEGAKVAVLAVDHRRPKELLIAWNLRDRAVFDVYRVYLDRGLAVLDTQNPGNVVNWVHDNHFAIRAAVAQNADGSSALVVRDDGISPRRTLAEFSFSDGPPQVIAFSPDDTQLYIISAEGSNTKSLRSYDLATGSARVLVTDPVYDVTSAFFDHATRELVAAAILRDRLEWTPLMPGFEADFSAMRNAQPGDIEIPDASADGNLLVVHYVVDDGPDAFFIYNREAKESTFLFYERPALKQVALAPMSPIDFTARDGVQIHGYLTLPLGIEPRRLPTILYVHGGPWHRDRWGYEPIVQWLANRGYAVLQVNYRGSTGYGRAFLNAGNREWAGAMRTDLLDARDWAIARGYSDPERFAIFGGSYGGYAVLAALTFTPNAFTCGVDIVGVSNLNTFLDSIPAYWKPMLSMLRERIGDDPEFLAAQSPLSRAADIRVPLLIGQGANDPRVRQEESDQIVAAMRKNGIPVTYIVFEDEGHGFANPSNSNRFFAAVESFLGETLGGRVESPKPGEEIEAFLR
jgi:dipeptidyl aminopeptidase/acylaminoacyl peptidase